MARIGPDSCVHRFHAPTFVRIRPLYGFLFFLTTFDIVDMQYIYLYNMCFRRELLFGSYLPSSILLICNMCQYMVFPRIV
jgi:hypothetical protein